VGDVRSGSVKRVAAAVGDVLFFLHADSVPPPDALARNTAVIERARALAAVRQLPTEPPAPGGPTREEFIQIVVASG